MEENYGSDLSGALEALRDGRKIPRKSWTAYLCVLKTLSALMR